MERGTSPSGQERTRTVALTAAESTETAVEAPALPVLQLRGPYTAGAGGGTSAGPRVTWAAGTVDNEHAGGLVSSCCCIYRKPRRWDESSTDSDEECETAHCRGHIEKRKPQPPAQPPN